MDFPIIPIISFPVICTMTALIHTGCMFLQHPSPETSFVTFLISAFLLFVSWKPTLLPLYSHSLSQGCFCSFYNYTHSCVYVKEVQVQAGLEQVQIFFLPKGVHLTISARGNKDRILTNTLCIIATDTSKKYFLQSITLGSKCHIYIFQQTVREKTMKA